MKTRTGKIARLPKPIREQLNQRLENGEPGTVAASRQSAAIPFPSASICVHLRSNKSLRKLAPAKSLAYPKPVRDQLNQRLETIPNERRTDTAVAALNERRKFLKSQISNLKSSVPLWQTMHELARELRNHFAFSRKPLILNH